MSDGTDARSAGPAVRSRAAGLYDRWRSLDRGWRAILVSTAIVLAVVAGVPIPW